jgi:uncharacterized protein (TIGR03437 family)
MGSFRLIAKVMSAVGVGFTLLAVCVLAHAQSPRRAQVCNTYDQSDCYFVDTSTIGGIRFEDYKVTNPKAVQFDPALRLNELAALGNSTATTLCQSSPSNSYILSPAAISFNNVKAGIRENPFANGSSITLQEFLDVEFANFATSGGYTSPTFGLKMARNRGTAEYVIEIHPGNPGLNNIPGLTETLGYTIDPVTQTANSWGSPPVPVLLRQAVFAVLMNARSILSAASFSTAPAASGMPLWTPSEIIALAGQAQSLIAATANPAIAPPPPFTCTYPRSTDNAYAVCGADRSMEALQNVILTWGGEYLGLQTRHSFQILSSNLLGWSQADVPQMDPTFTDNGLPYEYALMSMTKPILMLWPTLRDDPALGPSDRQLIESWITNRLMPRAAIPGGVNGSPAFTNNWGYNGASVQMANAIRRSDHQTFAHAVEVFYVALNQMRQDGSFPLEAARSACSASYMNLAIRHLISIAEMAATQGYDLYSLSVNGKTLETSIQFLLNARDNPALLYQYSKAGGGVCNSGNPGDPPDFASVFNSYVPSNLAWVESYLARFPLSTAASRLRRIIGSDITAPPFPLWHFNSGLNTTCAFRKSYEFQPVNGVRLATVSGDAQTVVPNQATPVPLSVRVTDNSGVPLSGTLVSFAIARGSANMIAPAQVLTDGSGLASANVIAGPLNGTSTVTGTALGTPVSFSLLTSGPAVNAGGIIGIAASLPAVTVISPGAMFSIYGHDFAAAGTNVSANAFNGSLPTMLAGVCVAVGGLSAPIQAVTTDQINLVAPAVTAGSTVDVVVTTGCGTPSAKQTMPASVRVALAAPEFFYFAHNVNGRNPVAAIHAVQFRYIGPSSLGSAFAPAHPGDLVTIFGSGFGPTNPPIHPGAIADGAAQATGAVTVRLGSTVLGAGDILYVGTAPGLLISQLNIRIPSETPPGNQPLQIVIGGIASPPEAFLPIAAP